jgi:hypothetical protein
VGVKGAGERGQNFFFKLDYLLYASAADTHISQSGAGL